MQEISFINETLASFSSSESLSQTLHRLTHIRKTIKKQICPITVHLDHFLHQDLLSLRPYKPRILSSPHSIPVFSFYNTVLLGKLFRTEVSWELGLHTDVSVYFPLKEKSCQNWWQAGTMGGFPTLQAPIRRGFAAAADMCPETRLGLFVVLNQTHFQKSKAQAQK